MFQSNSTSVFGFLFNVSVVLVCWKSNVEKQKELSFEGTVNTAHASCYSFIEQAIRRAETYYFYHMLKSLSIVIMIFFFFMMNFDLCITVGNSDLKWYFDNIRLICSLFSEQSWRIYIFPPKKIEDAHQFYFTVVSPRTSSENYSTKNNIFE